MPSSDSGAEFDQEDNTCLLDIPGESIDQELSSAPAFSFKEKVSLFVYTQEPSVHRFTAMASKNPRSAKATAAKSRVKKKSESTSIEKGSKVTSEAADEIVAEEADGTVEAATPGSEDGSVKSAKRKRPTTVANAFELMGSGTAKKARMTKPGSAVLVNNLKDTVRPGLILISVGLNPGKLTGELGHPYSHKSNKYWPGLFKAGITPVQHKPEDAVSLMDLYGLGHTNIVPDIASKGESDLTTQDFMDGAAVLDAKIREMKPQAVMLLGRGIWYRWMQYKTGKRWDPKKEGPLELGLQDEKYWIGRRVVKGNVEYEGAMTFVLESPSGQAAISSEARISNWKIVGDWFTPKREQWLKEQEV